ncbi:helix-turn-helix domain-containing protein [Amycolatopsis dendrobii]|uniref:Helix-turn-helix domain-containing protein n=1 Tax=Amycolatopsis dendrobii TaxID=2760662 RepID=A0A7W3Z9J8_9PSEU|nr:helix-turn-helix domain-containing protein [Amycolatopsis dendrobii]MBB1153476.1 helix-turn-helix domain-containing protein [Amycolatopsis dendrobii]
MTTNRHRTWPWPADTTLDRARRVAQIYRQALRAADTEECRRVDAQMSVAGQAWVLPAASTHDPMDLVTVEKAAEEMRVARRTIYSWREKGLPVIETPDGPRYRVADLREYVTAQRRRRARNGHV